MTNIKHKIFLLVAKYIPIATAIGILCNYTLYYIGTPIMILDFTIGVSLANILLQYAISYSFNFCTWHRIVITYNCISTIIAMYDYYIRIHLNDKSLLCLYYIIAGVAILYLIYNHNIKIKIKKRTR